ncbi:acyl-CoA dehydrogenase family protein [Paenibacillus nicotianae]|uniref:Acyl-CoA dehydrogenase family protein n=1 Tax=Paenibacillus nicotianae TaxID=1526551 RepID=A0ABW4UPV3_9BACL
MQIELNSEQIKWKEEFREFVDTEIVPYAKENDRQEKLAPEIIKKLKQKGYMGSMLPKEYGGMGLDWIALGIFNEELGRGCSSVRSLLTVHGMVALSILRWGTKEQKESFLPQMAKGEKIGAFALTEPEAGSDSQSIKSTATLYENHYTINGHKKWITMGQIADVFLVFVKYDGQPTAFLIDRETEGFIQKPISGLIGARATMNAELYFNHCKIPQKNVIGSIGTGLSYVALDCLDYGRYTVACGCVGLAQACLEESTSYSRNRIQFGTTLGENQLIQKMITEMTVNIRAARLLCYSAGYLKDILDPDSIIETWTAKYFASKIVNQIASDAIQIHGANGCSSDYPVERYMRDAKINEIIEGTTQIHEMLIASNTFRTV